MSGPTVGFMWIHGLELPDALLTILATACGQLLK